MRGGNPRVRAVINNKSYAWYKWVMLLIRWSAVTVNVFNTDDIVNELVSW